MNKNILLLLFALNGCIALAQNYCSNPLRFSEQPIFTNNQITAQSNVVYGSAINWQGQTEQLTFNVFYPKFTEDTFALRPFILIIHGGGFVSGNKEDWDNECREFAKRGFVAATIDYRLGLTGNCVVDSFSYDKAVYRAIQDARAALRFAVENAAAARIDTSWIFIGGGSAGAGTSLGVVYLSQADWDAYSPIIPQTLGPLNTSGNTLTNTFSIKGIMNNWGAIGKDFIQPNEMVPMIAFHGDADGTVDIDSAFANSCVNPPLLYGSRSLYNLFTNAGICADLSVKIGGGHGVYRYNGNNFRIDRTSCFFKSVMCNTCTNFYSTDSIPAICSAATDISENLENEKGFNVYPNPSAEDFTLSFDNASAKTVTLINAVGQVLRTLTTTDKQLTLSVTTAGMYFVTVQQGAKVWSEKIVKN
jgi:dienelactone hydrolase